MSLETKLAQARPTEDPLEEELVGTTVLRNLGYEHESAVKIGRFSVLGLAGTGAQGRVYAAYDPQLDRRVALKLLRRDGASQRRRLVQEGRALAKVKHANVVGVFEAGEAGGEVFIAMEFVEGATLDEWLNAKHRTREEILEVLRAAGRGLAAAHAQGLTHRDFKPHNVMVGTDGNVCVTDFGLASGSVDPEPPLGPDTLSEDMSTKEGAILGTPAYMAPEQHSGREATPASDQYAYCLTAYEALSGRYPFENLAASKDAGDPLLDAKHDGVGAWPAQVLRLDAPVDAAIRRGLDPNPQSRWPSIGALVDALEPTRIRVSPLRLFGGLLALAIVPAGLVAYQQHELGEKETACERAGASIEDVWSEPTEAAARDGLLATGLPSAAAASAGSISLIDRYVDEWRGAATESCRSATITATWDDQTVDRSRWCLRVRRVALEGLVSRLASAGKHTVDDAVPSAAGLSPVAPCLDPLSLDAMGRPPAQDDRQRVVDLRRELQRGNGISLSGDYEAAQTVARDVYEEAQVLGWPPLIARAGAQLVAETEILDPGTEEAMSLTVTAFETAARAGAWDLAAQISILAIEMSGRRGAVQRGVLWGTVAGVAGSHAADPMQLLEAQRLSTLATLQGTVGDPKLAIEPGQRSLEILTASLGPEHPSVASSLGALAVAHYSAGRYAEAIELFKRVLPLDKRWFGASHVVVAVDLHSLGLSQFGLRKYEDARESLTQSLEIRLQSPGSGHHVTRLLNGLGRVALGQEDAASARGYYERSLAMCESQYGADHRKVAEALTGLAEADALDGRFDRAEERYVRALDIQVADPDTGFRERLGTLMGLARAHLDQEEHDAALRRLDEAASLASTTMPPGHPFFPGMMLFQGRALVGLGRYADARDKLADGIRLADEGKHDPGLKAALQEELGGALASMGAHHDAVELLERALEQKVAEEADPDDLETCRFGLARALWGDGQHQRAVALASQARDALTSAGSDTLAVDAWLADREQTRAASGRARGHKEKTESP